MFFGRKSKNNSKAVLTSANRSASLLEDGPVENDLLANQKEDDKVTVVSVGRLEELKRREAELQELIELLRKEKLKEINTFPLTIGIVGFGNFGQFLAKTFVKYAKVIGTSRADYTKEAEEIGASYIPLSKSERFLQEVDVVLFAVAIKSFEGTVNRLLPKIKEDMERRLKSNQQGILFVDVCSVKEHPRNVMLQCLPEECDILCSHPMFGPISGANGWNGLRFIFEKTRVNKEILSDPDNDSVGKHCNDLKERSLGKSLVLSTRKFAHNLNPEEIDGEQDLKKAGMDRMERFLSIWEEEGCKMIEMTCKEHDMYAAKSQFITHFLGRVLGQQGLEPTPVDTKGFESVLGVVHSVTSDSFDLFEGLYKYNKYSPNIVEDLLEAMDSVIVKLGGDQHDC
ncbi:arogenate dehydrogenase (NADP+), plant [Chaetoceros tenuissimus]|uniref:Arogenate dehydrogenase (NADP+), plant n=1 Tax=Chaetoceros tenuissimus TaxID=426638 RepID=A0AAD3HCN8_9STRA|nr:arogenate dehydrogenase (NADP+), plant [Chaetoceros tenuissimus]